MCFDQPTQPGSKSATSSQRTSGVAASAEERDRILWSSSAIVSAASSSCPSGAAAPAAGSGAASSEGTSANLDTQQVRAGGNNHEPHRVTPGLKRNAGNLRFQAQLACLDRQSLENLLLQAFQSGDGDELLQEVLQRLPPR
mmetsp:Transcript_41182/g.88920  ORF Transcript_41182/g.88920 Transcript_41182/m.88920 type:complete len:141 (+) Transcript_41182:163-585(+)